MLGESGDVLKSRKTHGALLAFHELIQSPGILAEITKVIDGKKTTETISRHLSDVLYALYPRYPGNMTTLRIPETASALEEVIRDLRRFIGGALVPGVNNGILGNFTVGQGLNPIIVRRLEFLALKVYGALTPGQQDECPEVLKYEDYTTQWVKRHVATKGYTWVQERLPLSDTQREADKRLDLALEDALNRQSKFAAHSNIVKSIAALGAEKRRLITSYQEYLEVAGKSSYIETKARREKALSEMHVRSMGELTLDNRSCVDQLKGVLASSGPRTQIVLPSIRFSSEAEIESFARNLCSEPSGNPRVFIYHDSIRGSETYGKRCCLKVSSGRDGVSVEKMELDIYQRALESALGGPLSDASFASPAMPDQIVMLYDDTNKQGGDYGVFSTASMEATASDAGAKISQHIFLNIKKSGDAAAHAELSSGDMYQAQRRRRGTSTDPVPVIHTSLGGDRLSWNDLKVLPVNLLASYINTFASAQSGVEKQLIQRELTVCLAIRNEVEQRAALVRLAQSASPDLALIPLADRAKVCLISVCEKRQAQIEAYLQTTEAVKRIGEQLAKVPRYRDTAVETELRSIDASLLDGTRDFEAIESAIPRLETVLKRWQAEQRPEAYREGAVLAPSVARGVRGSAATLAVGGLAGHTVTVIAPKTEAEIASYRSIMESLNRLRFIQEYASVAKRSLG